MTHKPYPIAEEKPKMIYGQDCTTPAPCGNACVLDAGKRHLYHTCVDGLCMCCHGERFRTKKKAQ